MKALCNRFEISRETGYVWLRRFRQLGVEGLVELNRAPQRHPNQTAAAIEEAVLDLRQAHMTWGPRKLKRILERDQPGRGWPATSTVGRDSEACRSGGCAQEAAPDRALYAAFAACSGVEPCVVCRLQGLVQERGWNPHRPADDHRRLQPLPAALAGGGEDRHGASASHLRGGVS